MITTPFLVWSIDEKRRFHKSNTVLELWTNDSKAHPQPRSARQLRRRCGARATIGLRSAVVGGGGRFIASFIDHTAPVSWASGTTCALTWPGLSRISSAQ